MPGRPLLGTKNMCEICILHKQHGATVVQSVGPLDEQLTFCIAHEKSVLIITFSLIVGPGRDRLEHHMT
jgi:hypothetical protein